MQGASGVYEHTRDNEHLPCCWKQHNNQCFPHFHRTLELVYVRRGCMEATLNGKHFIVEAKQILVVPSYTVHLYTTPTSSDTVVLTIPLEYVSGLRSILQDKAFSRVVLPDCSSTREIVHCMNALLRPQYASDTLAGKGYIHVILGIMLDTVSLETSSGRADSGQTQQILRYLHQNYHTPLTLGQVSAAFGYSPSRFSHLFNENVGCSISHYINTLRCRDAAAAMLEQNSSVLDAAMSAGFESMRTFYRAFRRCYGVTPSQYIEQIRTGNLSTDDRTIPYVEE